MYIPVLSSYASVSGGALDKLLRKRSPVPEPRGGGGHGGGGHGSSSHSSGSGSEGSSGSSGSHASDGSGSSGSSSAPLGSRGSTIPVSGSASSRSSATLYGSGDSKVSTIPQGQPFAGRSVGGGTRDGVYGSSVYGSGYPVSYGGSGVVDRGFPYYYYPVVWPDHGYGPTYLHSGNSQYGKPQNSSRPGGAEMQAAFTSRTSPSTTFHVVADNSTVVALIATINTNCSSLLNANSSKTPIAINGSATDPLPEQAVQYYRASSVVLTLDGYNNTAALTGDANAKPIPIPANVDTTLLNCLNSTIGQAVPLFDSASAAFSVSVPGIFSLISVPYALWCFMDFFF
ncbi:hypothetical protein L226DRAFT_469372 [Lentinus tigrinus ALCF2SS1-7]|uniref:Uncharacterized protein n=1 Tax=Lentinus tigrinus ALCF2SS1-6 TaxID=1328759 RepID=A0A5C2SAP8_9APHY|nr:hypothetical protein L227DRAFT_563589 [Lentinus tigrinus ALCF2SS1-6]RPD70879.1 hypothetical protein L226DRAFT_469372 [Lentinus tigrinus ALCF2SS1-7]